MFSTDQYQAIREKAGIVDRSFWGKISVTGTDRASYLQGLLTNDIVSLTPGTGCYAAYLTPQGRMITDLHVLEVGDTILLEVYSGITDTLVRAFSELIFAEDVQISDCTSTWESFGVHGPKSADVVEAALVSVGLIESCGPTAKQLAAYPQYKNSRWSLLDSSLIIVRRDDLGEMGFYLYVDRERAPSLHKDLLATGGTDVSIETVNVIRVEAGKPVFGIDMNEKTIPLEAGIEDQAISLTKGCYVGQEVIARIMYRGGGRVARKLIGLVIEASVTPARGSILYSGETEIGSITSAVFSEFLEKPIALGYVQRDFEMPGSVIQVIHDNCYFPATVTTLPFVSGASTE